MNDLIPEKYRDDEELIRLTIEQLKKDFGSQISGFSFSGQKQLLFGELASQLAEVVEITRKSNPALLKAILYRVDVSERDITMSNDAKNSFLLAEKIIQREFKKVMIRRYYSGGTR